MRGHPIRRRKLARKETPLEKKEKEAKGPLQKKVAITMGKAYTLDQIQALIASLQSGSSDREVGAVIEFAEHQSQVSEAAASIPDVSGTEIMELVIAASLKNQQEMFTKLGKEGKVTALQFIAKSSSMPPQLQKKAEAVLQEILPQAPVGKEERAAPALIEVPYTPVQVKELINHLESKIPRMEVAAAIKFIKDYPRIAPTVAKMPMLTVTTVTEKAVRVIRENTDAVIDTMVRKRMVPALLFLASLSQVPPPIRRQAQEAAEMLMAPAKAAPAAKEIPMPAEPPKAAKMEPEHFLAPKAYTPWELEAMLDGLGSTEAVRAVKFAIAFFKNYQAMAESISKAPMLTVTQVSSKAVKVIESNLSMVLKELNRAKDIPTLEFIAKSAKFSDKTRKKAGQVLRKLLPAFDGNNQ